MVMVNNTLNVRDFLKLFDVISTQGTKVDSEYQFQGIRAWHDFDGYTCWLAYKDLTVTLLFHGKFSIDYEQDATFNEFYKSANALIK